MQDDPDRSRPSRRDRIGKRIIAGHFSEEEFRAFKVRAAQNGMGTNEALHEAIRLFHREYRQTPDHLDGIELDATDSFNSESNRCGRP
jgi:hypothetical protein